MKKIFLHVFLLTLFACNKEQSAVLTNDSPLLRGVFIVNEGGFENGKAGITYVNKEGVVVPDIYLNSNDQPLDDDLRGLHILDNYAYALVRSTGTINIMDMESFDKIGVIQGLGMANDLLPGKDHIAYVSSGVQDGMVYRVDLKTKNITGVLSIGERPGKMAIHENHLFVCVEGAFNDGNEIKVINLDSWSVTATMETGIHPVDLVVDADYKLWVMCSGITTIGEACDEFMHEPALLQRFDPMNYSLLESNVIEPADVHSNQLEVSPDRKSIYYQAEDLMAFDISNGFPGEVFINGAAKLLQVDPNSGDVWIGNYNNIDEQATVHHYNSSGMPIENVLVGCVPVQVVVW